MSSRCQPLELKGKSERVPAWQLLGVHRAAAVSTADTGPMVGREREMAQLHEAFRLAVEDRQVRTLTIIGDAGVGKSRLTREFLASVAEVAYVVRGRCLSYGRGITFWPLVEIVRHAAGIDEEDPPERAMARILGLVGDQSVADRLCSATGLTDTSFPLAELFWAVGRLVAILAERRPVVLVFDDIHWAEPTLLDLIEHLTSADLAAPGLVMCTARHELLELRATWGDGAWQARIELGPLGDDQAGQIVEALLGQSGLAPSIRQRVTAAAEGQPAVRGTARLDAHRRGHHPADRGRLATRGRHPGDPHPAQHQRAHRCPAGPPRTG